MPSTEELLLRLLGAALLGGLIGLERELSSQPAGLRTHLLVCLGSALFTVAGTSAAPFIEGLAQPRGDPSRVAAQVVSGIGFLGAGAIVHQGVNVHGLTTAATMWVTAAVGLAAGLGLGMVAAVSTVSVLLILRLLKPVEELLARRGHSPGHPEPPHPVDQARPVL